MNIRSIERSIGMRRISWPAIMTLLVVVCMFATTLSAQFATVQTTSLQDQRCCFGGRYRPLWAMLAPDGRYYVYSAVGKTSGSLMSGRMISIDPDRAAVLITGLPEPTPPTSQEIGSAWPYAAIMDGRYYTATRGDGGLLRRGLALTWIDITTGSKGRINVDSMATPSDVCVTAAADVVLISTQQGAWIVRRDGTVRRLQGDGVTDRPAGLQMFLAYADADQWLVCTQGYSTFLRSTDEGDTWTTVDIGSTLRLRWASMDPSTSTWYGIGDSSLYTIGPDLTVQRLASTHDRSTHAWITARAGTVVTNNVRQDEDMADVIVRFPNQEFRVTTPSNQAWGAIAINADGSKVHLGRGEQLVTLDRNGDRDTMVIDLDVTMERALTLRDGSIIGGSSTTEELRRSVDFSNWSDVDSDGPIAPALLCATPSYAVVCDVNGRLLISADTGRTFVYDLLLDAVPLDMKHMRGDTIAILYPRSLRLLRPFTAGTVDVPLPGDDTCRKMSVSPSSTEIAILTAGGRIFSSTHASIVELPQSGMPAPVRSIVFDADGRLWASTSHGTYQYDDAARQWTPERTFLNLTDSIELYRTFNGVLAARTKQEELFVRRPSDRHWSTANVTLAHVISVDDAHLFGQVSPIGQRSMIGPVTSVDTTRWIPVGPFEVYKPTSMPNPVIAASTPQGLIFSTRRGTHVMERSLEDVKDQWSIRLPGTVMNTRSQESITTGTLGDQCIMSFDIASERVSVSCISDTFHVRALRIDQGDTLWFNTQSDNLDFSLYISLMSGWQQPSTLLRYKALRNDSARRFVNIIGGSGTQGACLIGMTRSPVSTVHVFRQDGSTQSIQAPFDATHIELDVHADLLVWTYTEDSVTTIETYELPSLVRRMSRSFKENLVNEQNDPVTILSDGRHVLVQGETTRLLDAATLATIDSVRSDTVIMRSPFTHGNWVIGTTSTSPGKAHGLTRWRIRNTQLSVHDADLGPNAWSAYLDGDHIRIDDPESTGTVQYRLVDLTGAVHANTIERSMNSPSAAGLYIVQRIDLTRGTSSTRRLVVVR
jgi:hypothetical protein